MVVFKYKYILNTSPLLQVIFWRLMCANPLCDALINMIAADNNSALCRKPVVFWGLYFALRCEDQWVYLCDTENRNQNIIYIYV